MGKRKTAGSISGNTSEKSTIKGPPKKRVYLEIMRFAAVFFVIFNHTGDQGFLLFTKTPPASPLYWISLFLSVFCKFSVPLYFMISGALLLPREPDPLPVLFGKRIKRQVVVLLVISLIYELIRVHQDPGTVFSVKEYLKRTYSSGTGFHLWFIYFYIAFLISLPFLQGIASGLKVHYYNYMVLICLVFNTITITDYLLFKGNLTCNSGFRPSWLLANIVLFPCIGYYLEHHIKITGRAVAGVWALNLLLLALTCAVTYYKQSLEGVVSSSQSQTFHNCYVLINAVSVYMLIKYLTGIRPPGKRLSHIFITLGRCSFGIYLLHLMFIRHPRCIQAMDSLAAGGLPSLVVSLLFCALTMLVCFVITFLLRMVPVVRDYL